MFKCAFCNGEVIRKTNNGKKQKSCGCARKILMRLKLKRHDGKGTRLYNIWKGMKVRCYTKTHHSYKYYGDIGIKVCCLWKSNFVEFQKWSNQNGYTDYLTIDRINKHKDYSPDN